MLILSKALEKNLEPFFDGYQREIKDRGIKKRNKQK
jgi:hypothetical protein